MNYLAHAFLSFNNPGILTGNMISDFVKGRKKFDYPQAIQRGIMLHRFIDEFTDNHPATHTAKQYFREVYRLYAGAFVDVVYDHFLANDPNQFTGEAGLNKFCQSTYAMLEKDTMNFPPQFLRMFPYMQQQNWLYNYRLHEGIERSFEGLVRRAAYLSEYSMAYKIFNENYAALSACYDVFFPELKQFVIKKLAELNNS